MSPAGDGPLRATKRSWNVPEMLSEKIYRLLLTAYPAEHRREYGEPMAQLFRDRMIRDGGGVRSLAVWAHTIIDLMRTAPRERREAGQTPHPIAGRAVPHLASLLIWPAILVAGLFLVFAPAPPPVAPVSLFPAAYVLFDGVGPNDVITYTIAVDYGNVYSIQAGPGLMGFLFLPLAAGLMVGVGLAARLLVNLVRSRARVH